MAKVTLKLVDEPNNQLGIEMESDPAFPGPAAEDQTLTNAQYAVMSSVTKLVDAIGEATRLEDEED